MRNPAVAAIFGLLTLPLVASQCEEELPQPAITAANFTQVRTWYLSEYKTAGQVTQGEAIKDRFALRFASDGSYRRVLLSDDSETAGTWQLSDPDNRRLQLTNYQGAGQEFIVEGVTPESLYLYYSNNTGQAGSYVFKTVR